jgi:hypothetical protein
LPRLTSTKAPASVKNDLACRETPPASVAARSAEAVATASTAWPDSLVDIAVAAAIPRKQRRSIGSLIVVTPEIGLLEAIDFLVPPGIAARFGADHHRPVGSRQEKPQ